MPLDRMALLGWMVARERDEPGIPINGRDLMPRAATLCRDDPMPWNAVARAAGELYQLGCVTWRYVLYPGESSVPPPHLVNDRTFQQADGVMVTSVGYGMFANAHPPAEGTQITISGGQVAFGNIQNIDVFFLLESAEAQIDHLEVPTEVKEEARGILRKMREAGTSVGSSAAGSVVAAAIRQALGLP
jgi:hypothetical protein